MIIDGPILDKIKVQMNSDSLEYPFSLPIIKNLKDISFSTQVTFIVGENGTGKSTLLEAIAAKCGFGSEGGSKNVSFKTTDRIHAEQSNSLAAKFTLSWRKKPRDGYFFRAETFFNLANHLEQMSKEIGGSATFDSYGTKSLHEQSHGESFLSFFNNRLGESGFYILDEPEAALSPQRQLSLLKIINDLSKYPESQFIIATHSPILLAYPGATIYSCDGATLEKVAYEETKHYEITKGFLDNPQRYLQHLFS